MNTVKLAKSLMKLRERWPRSPDDEVGELQEVFNHKVYLDASDEIKKEIMLKSSTAKFHGEFDYPWDAYFGMDLAPLLHNKTILDVGCFTGGRSAAWYQRYALKKIYGIDVDPIYMEAATQFAKHKRIDAEFKVAQGEELPFDDSTFEAVFSFDVFEHVRNVQHTLDECWRVLKPGGRLFVVFPGYYHPIEHHLGLVSMTPFFHYFFSSKTIIRAYYEILQERGDEAYWYNRQSPEPEPWERCHTINGTTLVEFKRYLKHKNWKIVMQSRKPLGSIGRNISKSKLAGLIAAIFYPMTYIPGIQEIALHRFTYILEKPE